MKLLQVLMSILERAADRGKCLRGEEIFTDLGVEDPAGRFRASGKLEALVSIGWVREAEGPDGEKVYYSTRDEEDLVRQRVLSEGVHINVVAPDEEGGVDAARVDRGSVSDKIWSELVRGDRGTIGLMARRGRL